MLRLGHRPGRDKRLTTHVCLTARALGAASVTILEADARVKRTVEGVVERFGGPFEVRSGGNWRGLTRSFPGTVVHLTMYGEPLAEAVRRIPRDRDVLVVVGAEKVPADLYDVAHLNVAVGNQPHSEVAALALFLRELLGPAALERDFEGTLRIVPHRQGKVVVGKVQGSNR